MRFENYPKSLTEDIKEYPAYTVAHSIWSYIVDSYPKLKHLLGDLKSSKRTYVFNNGYVSYSLFQDSSENRIGETRLECYSHSNSPAAKYTSWYGFSVKSEGIMVGDHTKHIVDDWKDMISNILSIELFIQYAEIETRTLKPLHKVWEGVNCLYNNRTIFPIQIIDSTWFTTLVKSEGFKVRGHFRLQPHGHGLKEKKLIWISDFEKNGYTREAKMISQ